tara:strand:+ start:711 stop:908 length:198 start_codon:yes stop_codon:yes gene_type:complete
VKNKNRVIKLGEKARVKKDIASIDGMLHKDTIVKIDEIKDDKMRVVDSLGKIWWIKPSDVSLSFI